MKPCLAALLFMLLFPVSACGQIWDKLETYFLCGPTFTKTEVIGGSNVTVYGSGGYSSTVGLGYLLARKSAVGIWLEMGIPGASPGNQTASIPGSISLGSAIFTPGLRVVVPVQSRISLFVAAGGGIGDFTNPDLTSDNPPDLKTHDVAHGVFDFGGGVDIHLWRFLSLRVDVRDYVTGRDLGGVNGRNQFMPQVGVAFRR
jgi:hypothetical protein